MKWWWMEDEQYVVDEPISERIRRHAGPKGLAVVKAFDNGSTTSGWGEESFMRNYRRGRFQEKLALFGYEKEENNIAIVMRSVNLICIDIDGKNGGIEHAAELLGNVPLTLAETSKSGNGYHLFFKYEDEWHGERGFDKYKDAIGIVQGVDVRATGCVYHYPTQRWNEQEIAELPEWIAHRLDKRKASAAQRATVIQAATAAGGWEKTIVQHELIEDLNKPIPYGKRNSTLFAIGSQMFLADVEGWEDLIKEKALDIGLDWNEADKIVANISAYAARTS